MTKEAIKHVKDGLSRQKLFSALECIELLEKENEKLKQENEQLKGQVENTKYCHDCQSYKLNNLKNCQICDDNYSKWEQAE